MINLSVYNKTRSIQLEKLTKEACIGIFTGTFDPAHKAHVDIARQTLKKHFGGGGNDYVLFYPHSFTPNKNPINHLFRMEIIQEMIQNIPEIYILSVNDGHHISPMPPTALIDYLNENTPPKYSRIIGADKLSAAIKYYSHVTHFVNNRFKQALTLPINFQQIQSSENISSTELREGKVPFGEEYGRLLEKLLNYYPNGYIK